MNQSKISIIGTGSVGSTIAYALLLKNIVKNLYLIDINQIRCKGEVLDLSDTLPFCDSPYIRIGSFKDARDSDIIIIAAGKKQVLNQERIALFKENKKIVISIIETLKPINPNAKILIVANPVDLMTFFAQKYSGLPHNQVFGSGTFLDTQRLRVLLAEHFHIAEQSIHVYILGEHGDSQFPAWSSAYIAGIPISSFGISDHDCTIFAEKTKNKAYEIIACKDATFYGIATCVAIICKTIIFDQKKVTPLSCYVKEYGVYLNLPTILGEQGINTIFYPSLTEQEQAQLDFSAQRIKNILFK